MPKTSQLTTNLEIDSSSSVELPNGVLRARKLVAGGLSRRNIKEMTDAGALFRLGRGLYSLPDSPVTENRDLAQIAALVPKGVICLTSALQFHALTTASPWRIHLMLPRGARKPRIQSPPVALIYASEPAYEAGIEMHMIEGVPVQITSVAKTVADCFKYRNKVGMDIALEALKQTLEERRATRAEIRKYAKVCRVEKIMQPYVEALSI